MSHHGYGMNDRPAQRGRPRSFDIDRALGRALEVFWRKGYEATSISDLTHAIGINPPSLYAAFGSKEELFRQALDRYDAQLAPFWGEAMGASTAHEAIERLLKGSADRMSGGETPPGCLFVQGALCGGEECEQVKDELAARRDAGFRKVLARLKQARRDGDLPRDLDPVAIARFVITVLHGMAVQAAGGASRTELRRVAETALKIWPQ
jgi:AcrR family transcriptional regulator